MKKPYIIVKVGKRDYSKVDLIEFLHLCFKKFSKSELKRRISDGAVTITIDWE